MDAETLSANEIAVLFVQGGTSSGGLVTGGQLCYGVYNTLTSEWDEQYIGENTAASEAALAVSGGVPHIAYVTPDGDIAYTFLGDSGWAAPDIITSNDRNNTEGVLSRPDIGIDSEGIAYISYMDTQGADDDYYKRADVMLANNSTGEFVNAVVVNGTGYFDSPDGWRQEANSPKLTMTDSGYAVVCNYYQWNKWMGGSDNWYSAAVYTGSGSAEYHYNNSNYTIYEACSDGTNVYALIYRNGYQLIKYAHNGTAFTDVSEAANTTTVADYAGDLALDGDKLCFTAVSGSSMFLYMDGETASTDINTSHKKVATVVEDGTPYVLYTGSDENYSLVITKYEDGEFVEYAVPNAPTPAEAFLAQVADDTTSEITLTEDIDLSTVDSFSGLTVSKDLTIDLNGYTLNVGTDSDFYSVVSDAALTLTDSSEAGTGRITNIGDLAAVDGGSICIDSGSYYLTGFAADDGDISISGGAFFVDNGDGEWDSDNWDLYVAEGKAAVQNPSGGYIVIDITLTAGTTYKQTADKDGTHYIRYVFVVPKSDIEAAEEVNFVANYNGTEKTIPATAYYTGVTSNGVRYAPADEENVLLVVTITGVPAENEEQLTCDYELCL